MESIAEKLPERNGKGHYTKDFTGKVFHYWTVMSYAGQNSQGYYSWNCRCICGSKRVLAGSGLKRGKYYSCGCHKRRNYVIYHCHDKRLNGIWHGMIHRCHNEHRDRYNDWGGRGINVCDEWRNNFDTFADWSLSHGYSSNMQIDRIDNDGDYTPENCRWASSIEQGRNTRRNHIMMAFGEEKCIAQWAEDSRCIVCPGTLSTRLSRGYAIDVAMTTPILGRQILRFAKN